MILEPVGLALGTPAGFVLLRSVGPGWALTAPLWRAVAWPIGPRAKQTARRYAGATSPPPLRWARHASTPLRFTTPPTQRQTSLHTLASPHSPFTIHNSPLRS